MCCWSTDPCAAESTERNTPVLSVITMPTGRSAEARFARALIPSNPTSYRLQPLVELPDSTPDDAVRDGFEQADGILTQAQEAALAFDLVLAARLKRQAADQLLRGAAVVLSPARVATYLLIAGGASVEAKERDLAVLYFRYALAVDRKATPGPEISPEAKAVFHSAAVAGPLAFREPHDRLFRRICSQKNVDGILWIAVSRDEEGMVVTQKIILDNDEPSESNTRRFAPKSEQMLWEWLAEERERMDTRLALKLNPGPLVGPDGLDAVTPWYKDGRVYTTVGGVIAAGVAALAIFLAVDQPEIDVVVHH